MIRFKAHFSRLEWSVDDLLDELWPNHRLLPHGSPEWQHEQDTFLACMAYGNADLCLQEDDDDMEAEEALRHV